MSSEGPPPETMKSYEEAIWGWFLPQAKIPNTYGGFDERATERVMRHLAACGLDYAMSTVPDVGTYAEFAGTFTEGNQVRCVKAEYWFCRCDKHGHNDDSVAWYSDGELVVKGEFTLGRIIYEVIQNGLGNPVKPTDG